MAAIDQINVNIGTEQSPNYVLHDVNSKRISSTAVTTATHLLATDANLSAINPITAANLASVLGVPLANGWNGARVTNINTIDRNGFYFADNTATGLPDGVTDVSVIIHWRQAYGSGPYGLQMLMSLNTGKMFARQATTASTWESWERIDNFGCNTPEALASLLGVSTISGETTTLNLQLITGNKTAGIVVAYDMDDITKYCSAVIYVGSDSSNYILKIISKDENNGMTIDGGFWGYVTFGGITEGHRIKYKYRELIQ